MLHDEHARVKGVGMAQFPQQGAELGGALEALEDFVGSFSAMKAVPRIDTSSADGMLHFMRQHVAMNRPAVLTGVIDHWPALQRWSLQALAAEFGEHTVSVNTTPNGLADAIVSTGEPDASGACELSSAGPCSTFATPEVSQMPLAQALEAIGTQGDAPSPGTQIVYLSAQDDCLRKEFPFLLPDIDARLDIGGVAFGNDPDAINLWVGTGASTSTLHKDPYENLYAVVTGCKVFTLLPPGDAPWLPERSVPAGQYRRRADGTWYVAQGEESGGHVSWIDVGVLGSCAEGGNWPAHTHPVTVHVRAGEVLYLPAGWYHQVTQVGPTIAVNYWHDMAFGPAYGLQSLLLALGPALRQAAQSPPSATEGVSGQAGGGQAREHLPASAAAAALPAAPLSRG